MCKRGQKVEKEEKLRGDLAKFMVLGRILTLQMRTLTMLVTAIGLAYTKSSIWLIKKTGKNVCVVCVCVGYAAPSISAHSLV